MLPYSRGITCSFAHLSNNERVEATALTVSLRPHSVRLHSAELQSATAVRLYMRPLRLTKTRPRRLSKLECHSSVVTSGSGLAVISLHFHILDLFHSLSCWMNARILHFSFFFLSLLLFKLVILELERYSSTNGSGAKVQKCLNFLISTLQGIWRRNRYSTYSRATLTSK